MSYKFYSLHTGKEQDSTQWDGRSISGELAAFSGRSLVSAFDKYLDGHKFKIIEAGCGLGAWCEWFKQKGHEVVGLEYFEDIVTKAKSLIPESSVELGDVTAIKYADNSFDMYVSLGVVEHFENGPELALNEAYRVLKSDGIAFFTVPVLSPLRKFIAHPVRDLYFFVKSLSRKPKFFWEYRYTSTEIRTYIEKAGFEVLEGNFDDYICSVNNRHMGLWADWFFLRNKSGEIWELNTVGKLLLRFLKMFLPTSWYCCGWLVVCRARK
jgi:ubiquinone/menaquinone biosynthesis C-methylase UbiE